VTDWAGFAGVVGVVLVLLLALARASQGYVPGRADDPEGASRDPKHPGEPPVRESVDGAAPSGSTPQAGPPTDRVERSTGTADPAANVDRSDPPRPARQGEHPAGGEDRPPGADRGATGGAGDPDDREVAVAGSPSARGDGADPPLPRGYEQLGDPELSTAALLANVALSQGVFGVLLVAGAIWAAVPPAALGLGVDAAAPSLLLAGVAAGVGLYAANEAGAVAGERFGLGGGEALREALAPESAAGWVVLLGVVLPIVAAFEELLFRGALIGALAAAPWGLSPWVLAVGSSIAFALGHGAQGRLGVVVTGVLGFALAAVFVTTGSLVAVIVAHYLVNALEFVVHEGFGVDWNGE
jgi:membrane protease YdiL (CAAX protease family)